MHVRALTKRFSIQPLFTKAVAALAIAGVLGMALPPSAHADGRWDPGAAAIVGVIGGLALGSALSGGGRGSVGYSYGYASPDYGPPRYERWHHHHGYGYGPSVSYSWGVPQPSCYIVNERVWVNGWGWDVRPVRYCD